MRYRIEIEDPIEEALPWWDVLITDSDGKMIASGAGETKRQAIIDAAKELIALRKEKVERIEDYEEELEQLHLEIELAKEEIGEIDAVLERIKEEAKDGD